MDADRLRTVREAVAGRAICAECAEAFLAVLDEVRARRPDEASQEAMPESS